MTHSPIDVAVNPNDPAQRYILWTNGRIDNVGGAPPSGGKVWYEFPFTCAMALHITNWTTGQGYMLDPWGGFWPLNGAPDLRTADQAGTDEKVVPGIPVVSHRCYIDWSWDPSGSGQGYVLDLWGRLYPFGGATESPRGATARFIHPQARRLNMRWSPSKLAVTLDLHGGLYGDWFDIQLAPGTGNRVEWARDWARDLFVSDWSNAPAIEGYTLDLHGETHVWGGAPTGYVIGDMWENADVARAFHVFPADPTRIWQVWSGGQQFEYPFSTPPAVVAGGSSGSPASTVTATTRPELTWSYSDPQGDSQRAWQLLVFTQSFVNGHAMSDPLRWTAAAVVAQEGNQRSARGIVSPVDLANGGYRMYVRAQDSAGQWSTWSNRGWTQSISAPATPTGLSAVADDGSLSVALSVQVTSSANADLVRFEWSDDGAAWFPVRGADAVPRQSTTTARDWDAPLGRQRIYRAYAYSNEPRVTSDFSNNATATVTRMDYTLASVKDPTLGGIVRVQEPVEWVRPVVAGTFQGVGAEYATVVSDGTPKARRFMVSIFTADADQWEMVERLVESDSVLVYRDPFGSVRYCRPVGEWRRSLMSGAADRHMHTTDLPLVEVAPPGSS